MVRLHSAVCLTAFVAGLLAMGDSAQAQGYGRTRPTVSPYLNLLQSDGGLGGLPNYQTLVRPQVQQLRMNRQTNNQLRNLQSQVGSIQNSLAPSLGAPQGIRPTGRSGVDLSGYYGNLDHYYGGVRTSNALR